MVHVITTVTKLFCTATCNWLMQGLHLEVWLQKAESDNGVRFVTMSYLMLPEEAAISKCRATLSVLGTNMVRVKIRGETTEPTPMRLYLAAGESDQSDSGHIIMKNLRIILHGLPDIVPIICKGIDDTNWPQKKLQSTVDDLSEDKFPAGAQLLIWPGEHHVTGNSQCQ